MVMRPSAERSSSQQQSLHPPYPVTPQSSQPPTSQLLQSGNGPASGWDANNPWKKEENDDQDAQTDSGSDWDAISDDDFQESSQQPAAETNVQSQSKKLPIHSQSSQDVIPDRLRIGVPLSSPVEASSADASSLQKLGLPGVPSAVNSSPSSPQRQRLNSNPFLRKREEDIQRQTSNTGSLSPNPASVWDGGDLYEIPNTPFNGYIQTSTQPLESQVSNQSVSGQMAKPIPINETPSHHKSPSDNAPELMVFPEILETSKATKENQPRSPLGSPSRLMQRPKMVLPNSPASSDAPEVFNPNPFPQTNRTSGNQINSTTPAGKVPQITIPSAAPIGAPPEVETPRTKAKRERNEFYHIKLVRWHDASSEENPRTSPILIQNANGPCPLLALVNALALSTPAKTKTALVETLRTREQVSLGLLLDAVFDELTSGRRGGGMQELPDVSDLYSFLITLHTGMNVNPRFIPPRTEGPSLLDLDDYEEPHLAPGEFEQTREMRLYSTFSLPLIHGWMPVPKTEAYAAFSRRAQTYEDAQNIQFQEEDLEAKLRSEGLSSEEQSLYIDLRSIKQFFSAWPTQLTHHGLETLKKALAPGSFSILFRNDHFSTIYKEPVSGSLMTLVTDAGYATHDEIVWESLVDINGTNSEMYAGDFKSVSHTYNDPLHQTTDTTNATADNSDNTWTTVQPRNRRNQPSSSTDATHPTATPNTDPLPVNNTEQEDHDLALALALQEEEEEESRRAATARRREDELSHRFLSSESARRGPEDLRPSIPARRTGSLAAATTTTAASSGRTTGTTYAPPAGPAPGGDLPTYEQAARGTPFVPPRGHPASEHAPATTGAGAATARQTAPGYRYDAPGQGHRPARRSVAETGRRVSARQSLAEQLPAGGGAARGGRYGYGYAAGGAGHVGGQPARRRTVEGFGSPGQEDRDKCVVM